MKKLKIIRIIQFLIYVLPAALYLSYFPVISLGAGESMNFELSISLLWLMVFDLIAVVGVFKLKKTKVIIGKWYYYLFPFFVTLSVFWTQNTLRGVLTLGVMWAVIIALMAFVVFRKEIFDERFKKDFWKWFFGATLMVCAWCFIQCVLDLVGVGHEHSLMCLGCTYRSFGFPHPNGFAIEPQFMGNLLLAPVMIATWMMVQNDWIGVFRAWRRSDSSLWQFCRSFRIVMLLFIFAATLFLTFSRGAIYAFGVGVIFLSCFALMRAQKNVRKKIAKRIGAIWLVLMGAFVFILNLQGLMTMVSPTDDTYADGVSRAISQLTLGVINLKDNRDKADENLSPNNGMQTVENYVENFADEAVFDGYVPESTDIRVKLTSVALELWRSDVWTMLFGVGIGGAGQALYDAGLIDSPKEIVQNEYANLLLEVGLVGVLFAIIMIIGVLKWMWKLPGLSAVLPLLVAYGVSLCFFSGLPNALHIYLLPVVLCFAYRKRINKKALA